MLIAAAIVLGLSLRWNRTKTNFQFSFKKLNDQEVQHFLNDFHFGVMVCELYSR